MLTPFDDFPIHASADPIAVPASADTNHYDRYWFNGHQRDGAFYFGAAMGHTLKPRGSIRAVSRLIAPPLPAASQPSKANIARRPARKASICSAPT